MRLLCTPHFLYVFLHTHTQSACFSDIATVSAIRTSPFDVYDAKPLRWVVAGGGTPALCSYNTAEELPVAELAKDVARRAASAAFSFVKTSLWGRTATESPPRAEKPTRLSGAASFADAPREVESLEADPTGRYLAAADNLGRVAIIDVAMFTLVKLLKGYRQAKVVWLPPTPTVAVSFLVYLPRRGVVEAWSLHAQKRLAATTLGFNCRLMPVNTREGLSCLVVHPTGATSALVCEEEKKTGKRMKGRGREAAPSSIIL